MARQRACPHRLGDPRSAWRTVWLGGVLAALTIPGFAAPRVPAGDLQQVEAAIEAQDFPALLEFWERARTAQDADAAAVTARLTALGKRLYDELGTKPRLDHLLFIAELSRGEHNSVHANLVAARMLLAENRLLEGLRCLREAAETMERLGYDESVHGVDFRRRLTVLRVRSYRRLGWVDRAMRDAPSLEQERDRLRADGVPSVGLSNVLFTLADLDVMNERWSALAEWLADDLEAGVFLPGDAPQATYWLAQATFERDPANAEGVEQARAFYHEVLDDESTDHVLRARTHLRLARMAMRLGEYDEAKRQIAFSESVAPGELQSEEDHAHRCVFAMRLARSMNSGVEEASRNLLEAWGRTLDAWSQAPLLPEGVGFLAFGNQERIVTEVLETTLTERGPSDALRVLYDFDKIGTLSRKLATKGKPAGFHSLMEGELLLRYFVTDERTHVFSMAGDSVEYGSLELSSVQLAREIEAANRHVRESPRSKDVPRRRAEGMLAQMRRLHDLLLPENLRGLLSNHSKLSICGVDQLGHLPFECLVGEAGVPLGLTHEVAYMPSTSLKAQLTSDRFSEPTLALYSGANELGLEAGWEDGLLASYPRSAVSSKFEVIPDLFGTGRTAVLQFLGHGRSDSKRDVPAIVVLDGGVVGAAEVLESPVTARLAVITACDAWRGLLRPGDGGVGHLGSAFLQRGSQAVVLPDAEVEVRATLAWCQVFHAALVSGASPARSALEARRALASMDDYEDPFYHSLLHVVGDGHTPLFEARREPSFESGEPTVDGGGVPWRELLAVGGLLLVLTVLVSSINSRRAG